MSETLNASNKNPLDELSSKAKSRPVCNVKEMQAKIDKLERELEQFPDHRWMEKYYDKVEELNRAERDNEVLKEACEFYANECNWDRVGSDEYFWVFDAIKHDTFKRDATGRLQGGREAYEALSKIRSEGMKKENNCPLIEGECIKGNQKDERIKQLEDVLLQLDDADISPPAAQRFFNKALSKIRGEG